MNISIIGTGYVGLVTGACFAEFGFKVVCVDKDTQKIDNLRKGQIPIYEPGLESLVAQTTRLGHLTFSRDLKNAVSQADIVFIAVGTPARRGDGYADLSYVYQVAEEIAQSLTKYTVVVTKSTIPVGTCRKVEKIIQKTRPDLKVGKHFDVAANPEFLREGSAINDFMRPDRVVIGVEALSAQDLLKQLYRPLYLIETPIVFTNLETAELIKYAANGFLAMKIAFINEIADLCEKTGADVQDVAKAIGFDKRIGHKFLHAGPGYGGSCFPKDTLALTKTAQDLDTPLSIIETVVSSNKKRKEKMAQKIIEALEGSVSGKTIAILGVTFKPNTDDMREAPSLTIIPLLQEKGAIIHVYDPVGIEEAKKYLNDVKWFSSSYACMEGADGVVILTEWNEFRGLDLKKMFKLVKNPLLIDLRNIYKSDEVLKEGFNYIGVGRNIFYPNYKSPPLSLVL